MAQIIITIPEAKTLGGEALEAAIDMVEHVAEDLRNGMTSGHIDPQRHWTFEGDVPYNLIPARIVTTSDGGALTVGVWTDSDGLPVVQIDTPGVNALRVNVDDNTCYGDQLQDETPQRLSVGTRVTVVGTDEGYDGETGTITTEYGPDDNYGVTLDGDTGEVILNPTEFVIEGD